MKMERLSQDKIRIFLTFDDLSDRGIPKDDMLKETMKLRELFMEMMEQAYSELGFDPTGPLAVEVFSMPAQGMVVIVTSTSVSSLHALDDMLDEHDPDEMYSMEVMLEESDVITYAFSDFEHVIRAAQLLLPIIHDGGLYKFNDRWILQFDQVDLDESAYQNLIAILSEFGEAISLTPAMIQEYGQTIMANEAIQQLCRYFD